MAKKDMDAYRARREAQAAEGQVAMAEYLSSAEQRLANRAKQREARLARDAAIASEPPVKKPSKKKSSSKG
jgi:hypothetical protein